MGLFSGKPLEKSSEIISRRGESSVMYFTDGIGTLTKQVTSAIQYESKEWRPTMEIASENFGRNFMRGTVTSILNNRFFQFLIGSIGCYFAVRSFILLQPLVKYITFMYMNPTLTENDQFNYLKYMNRHTLFIFCITVTNLFALVTRSDFNENIIRLQVIIFDVYSIIKIVYCAIYFRALLYDLFLWLSVFCIILIINIRDSYSTNEDKHQLFIFILCTSDILANIIVLILPYLLSICTICATYIDKYCIFAIGITSALSILLALILLCQKRKRGRKIPRGKKRLWDFF